MLSALPAAARRLLRPSSTGYSLAALLTLCLGIAAVLVVCVGLGMGYQAWNSKPQRFETAVGAQRSLNLADGTHVVLNTDTVIHTSITSASVRGRTVPLPVAS